MARKTSSVRARMEPELKEEVEDIFDRLGVSASDAIRLFYYQVRLHRGLPFPVRLPNPDAHARQGRNLERFETLEELFASWEEKDASE